MTIETVNASNGEVLATYSEMESSEVLQVLEQAHKSFLDWSKTSFSYRSEKMQQAAAVLRKNKHKYAHLMAQEMGKPVTAGLAEIEKCAWVCEHYAQYAEEYLKPHPIKTEMQSSFVCYRPMGLVFAIMPWNFPFWQVFRFAAPSLMAGNGGLLKHAPISTGTGLAIEEVFIEAGFPANLFRTLVIDVEPCQDVINHPAVTGVTLTGSERAGSIVAAQAGKALKPVVMELGGSDPYIILEDADLDMAAQAIVKSRMNNSGQVCIAAKRIIAVESIKSQLLEKVLERLKDYQMGDPLDPNTNFGPMARADLRDEVHAQVEKSIQQGAVLLTGGAVPNQAGFYYPPTVLDAVEPGMLAFEEEIFGPVIVFVEARNQQHAIELANDTPYGLGAAVFTQDIERGKQIAVEEVQAGCCFVNDFVASDPRLPFGGIKRSGFGRELAQEGILSFVNRKTVAIR